MNEALFLSHFCCLILNMTCDHLFEFGIPLRFTFFVRAERLFIGSLNNPFPVKFVMDFVEIFGSFIGYGQEKLSLFVQFALGVNMASN